jgi:hypothetical protein
VLYLLFAFLSASCMPCAFVVVMFYLIMDS